MKNLICHSALFLKESAQNHIKEKFSDLMPGFLKEK
jgi:hypothetical protein